MSSTHITCSVMQHWSNRIEKYICLGHLNYMYMSGVVASVHGNYPHLQNEDHKIEIGSTLRVSSGKKKTHTTALHNIWWQKIRGSVLLPQVYHDVCLLHRHSFVPLLITQVASNCTFLYRWESNLRNTTYHRTYLYTDRLVRRWYPTIQAFLQATVHLSSGIDMLNIENIVFWYERYDDHYL